MSTLLFAGICLIPLVVGLVCFWPFTAHKADNTADVKHAQQVAWSKADKAVFAHLHPDTATAKARRREQQFRKGQTK